MEGLTFEGKEEKGADKKEVYLSDYFLWEKGTVREDKASSIKLIFKYETKFYHWVIGI